MALHLKTLLGDHAASAPLKRGDVTSQRVVLDFADVKVPNTAFKTVVRDLAFDVTELAIVTFLMARAQGVPLTLLPVVLMARWQHPFLVYDTRRGSLTPADLEGRRVGVRSWTVTTAVWLREILACEHGIDIRQVRWVTLDDAHVAGFPDPEGVDRAPPGSDILAMLRTGAIDAAIVGALPEDPVIQPVIRDPAAAAEEWRRAHDALQLNHLVAVKTEHCQRAGADVDEVCRMFVESKARAGLPAPGQPDMNPIGVEAIRHSLEIAIDVCVRQCLIPRAFTVDELVYGSGSG